MISISERWGLYVEKRANLDRYGFEMTDAQLQGEIVETRVVEVPYGSSVSETISHRVVEWQALNRLGQPVIRERRDLLPDNVTRVGKHGLPDVRKYRP